MADIYNKMGDLSGKTSCIGFFKMNKDFIDEFYLNNETILDANIYAHRIIANIFVTLKNKQFYTKSEDYPKQLQLFDTEFMTIDNSTLLFTMNSYEICKGGNYKALDKALLFLENFKKDWYTSTNSKGQSIKTYGGLIAGIAVNVDTGNFQFHITSHWLKKILELTNYNQTFYTLIQNVSSSKQIVFWHWLSALPENGTTVHLSTLNKRFGLNYKTARDLGKGFLKQVRASFDKYSHESFNYSISKDKITIVKYLCNPENLLSEQEKKTSNKLDYARLKKTYKLSYLVKRHSLNDSQKIQIKMVLELDIKLMIDSYQLFKERCISTKNPMKNFVGKDFMDELQECVRLVYLKTMMGQNYPTAYPRF